jgi:hypothetical protein
MAGADARVHTIFYRFLSIEPSGSFYPKSLKKAEWMIFF